MTSGRVAVGTVVARNYLPFARVLGESLRRFHPDVPFVVVVVDGEPRELDREPFETATLAELELENARSLAFRYTRQQLVVATKARLLHQLLTRGHEAALFLDADTLVLGALDETLATVARHPITLVPHLLEPPRPGCLAHERLVLLAGTFNGGVLGVSRSEPAMRFLDWWQDRLATHCRHAVGEGMHFDQRWLDLVPQYFDDVHILRDPGVDVAYWNLAERPVLVAGDEVRVGDRRCVLFHFSGYDPRRPAMPTRYDPALGRDSLGEAAVLFVRYREALAGAGWDEGRSVEYGFGRFDNGVPIPDIARTIFLEDERRDRFGDPFATAPRRSFFRWLRRPARGVARLWLEVHARRADLRAAFPEPTGADGRPFAAWIEAHGRAEHAVHPALVGRRSLLGPSP